MTTTTQQGAIGAKMNVLDAIAAMMDTDTRPHITFPMSLSYMENTDSAWGAWECLRELVQNAWDADPDFQYGLTDDGTLWISDSGSGIEPRHLLMGNSEKATPNARGMFGEGLKMAMLVLTRMGLTANIFCNGYHFWNEPDEMFGVVTFKMVWEESVVSAESGMIVEIKNWTYGLFEDRFIRPGDPRIAFEDKFGGYIIQQSEPAFFVKGVWLSKAEGYGRPYAFGYNLTRTTINRDRRVVNSWDANCEIGKIWGQVTDPSLLRGLMYAVRDGRREKDIQLPETGNVNAAELKQAFSEVYGVDAVLHTDDAKTAEANYRGANVVMMPGSIRDSLMSVVTTDADFLIETDAEAIKPVNVKNMGSKSKRVLRMLRRQASRIDDYVTVEPYFFANPDIHAEISGTTIRINEKRLTNPDEALATLVHELAHYVFHTDDATAEHVNACCLIASRLLMPLVFKD